jgi:hypothetical protein
MANHQGELTKSAVLDSNIQFASWYQPVPNHSTALTRLLVLRYLFALVLRFLRVVDRF